MADAIKKEEIIFFIDLKTNFIKRKSLIKSIQNFIQEKNKYSLSNPSSYGLVIFQKEHNPINFYDKPDEEEIVDTLNSTWETRETEQTYFENGLFEILSYVFRKGRKEKNIYRIIIISDNASERSDDYYNAAYDLIVKAKFFDTIIDVIRIGEKTFYEDDIKLKIITSESNGGLFYCNDKQFSDVLDSLVQKKSEFHIIKSQEELPLLQEDRIFYEKLAVDLISLDKGEEEICSICQQEVCPICELYTDSIMKCYNCSAKFHSCCIAEYAISNNIGFKHIFRCPSCDTLLKLDQEFVEMIYLEKFGEEIGEHELNEILDSEKTKEDEVSSETPPISLVEENLPQIVEEEDGVSQKEVRIGVFGPKIKVKTNKKMKIKSIDEQEELQSKEIKKSITTLKPPGSSRVSIKICPICGNPVSNASQCSHCGCKIN